MNRLQYFPVTFFVSVMGTGGLALAWRRASVVFGAPTTVSSVLFWLALALWLAVAVAYTIRWVRYRESAIDELRQPAKLPFLAAITIGPLLLATAGQDVAPSLAETLWWLGALGNLAMTVYVMTQWVNLPGLRQAHVNPAWFIPVVGNLLTPLAGPSLGSVRLSWLAFSVGAFFWLTLTPIVLARLFLAEPPLPARLQPTLAILIAPPAVAPLALAALVPQTSIGLLAGLTDVALFSFVLLLAHAGRLAKLPFAMSWWAYSFPLAALAAATIASSQWTIGAPSWVGWALLVLSSALVAGTAGADRARRGPRRDLRPRARRRRARDRRSRYPRKPGLRRYCREHRSGLDIPTMDDCRTALGACSDRLFQLQ